QQPPMLVSLGPSSLTGLHIGVTKSSILSRILSMLVEMKLYAPRTKGLLCQRDLTTSIGSGILQSGRNRRRTLAQIAPTLCESASFSISIAPRPPIQATKIFG